MPTVRLPLVGNPNNRSGDSSKDQRFVNCFPEEIKNELTEGKKFFLQKRFGTTAHKQPTGATGVARGMYAWSGYILTCIGNKVYFTTTGASPTSTAYTPTLTTSTGYVGFVEGFDNGVSVLIFSDGIGLWKIAYGTQAAGSMVAVTAGYPTPHHPSPVFLDNYLFVQKTTGEIYNSAAGDVDSGWADYISPESFEDPSVGLARQNNLIVAFGTNSIEFFYDAANASGSPLLPNEQATIQFGCAALATVSQDEGLVAFVAQAGTGGKFVVAIDGTTPHNISTPAIERLLEAEGSDIQDAWAYSIRIQGHFFYVLNLDTGKRTLVYDYDTKMWHEWNWYDTTLQGYTMFPMIDQVEIGNTSYMMHDTDGYIYVADPDVYRDNGNALRVQIQTSKFDGDTSMVKFCSRLSFIGDEQTSASAMTVYYTDDDYQNWKPSGGRTTDLSNRAYLYRLGTFRRRAFQFTHTANTPLRLEAIELEIEKGIH